MTVGIPKIMINKYNIYLFIYVFITMFTECMFWVPTQMLFIKRGIPTYQIAEVFLICTIPGILFIFYFSKYLKIKMILQQYHMMMIYHAFVSLFMYSSLLYFMKTSDKNVTYYLLIIGYMLDIENALITSALMAFYTKVADPAFRSTTINI